MKCGRNRLSSPGGSSCLRVCLGASIVRRNLLRAFQRPDHGSYDHLPQRPQETNRRRFRVLRTGRLIAWLLRCEPLACCQNIDGFASTSNYWYKYREPLRPGRPVATVAVARLNISFVHPFPRRILVSIQRASWGAFRANAIPARKTSSLS